MNRLRKMVVSPTETTMENMSFGENERMEQENEEPVCPFDLFFHKDNVHILAIMGFKTKIDPSVVKANLPHTLLKHPRFSSLMVKDLAKGNKNMKWVRAPVNIDDHVIIPELEKIEGDTNSGDKFVEDYIHNLTETSLNTRKPLWELHILNVKTAMSESVAVFRIHHSFGDGISLMSLLLACMRKNSDPNALPTLPTANTADQVVGYFATGKRFLGVLLGFWWTFKMIWNTVLGLMMFVATVFFAFKDSKTPIKGSPSDDQNSLRRVVFGFVDLDDMKLVKNAMNMTINDVAVGITQAGLSKYLNKRYGLESKNDKGRTQKKNNIPNNIRLRSLLFINLRQSSEIQDLADMMEKNTKLKWGNHFGYVLLPLTIGLRDDPLDYVREAKATVDRKKYSREAICNFFILGLVYKFFGLEYANSVFRRVFINTTMTFSNVAGPIEEVDFYGHPMAYIAATTYCQANVQELMVNFQSYGKKMTIVLSVDENIIPNPKQLLDDIIQSFEVIKEAVIQNGTSLDDK